MTDRLLNQKWKDFYNKIKDPSWPDPVTEDELLDLPRPVLRELLFDHFFVDYGSPQVEKTWCSLNSMPAPDVKENSEYFTSTDQLNFDLIWMANDVLKVHYSKSISGEIGSGMPNAKVFADIIKTLYPGRVFRNCLEWCAGAGFIGFEIFAQDLCDNLYLHDIYPPCIESVKTTIANNKDRCQGRVFYHHSPSVSTFPEDWKFDLIVANPPFYGLDNNLMSTLMYKVRPVTHRMGIDEQWKIHEDFFNNIKKSLAPNGVILMSESVAGSGPDTFRSMIEKNGLYINDCYWQGPTFAPIYFMEIKQT